MQQLGRNAGRAKGMIANPAPKDVAGAVNRLAQSQRAVRGDQDAEIVGRPGSS
jgi:hypothetical protein